MMGEESSNVVDLFDVGEDSEARDEAVIAFGTPALVFIIDCSNLMLKPVNYLLTTLKAIRKKLRGLIVRPSRFFASVILMATDSIKNDANVKNIYVLFPLLPTGVDMIKHLDDAIKLASTDAFEKEYGTSDFCLSDALWVATTLLQEAKRKLKKCIFLLTTNSTAFSSHENVRVFSIVSDFERSKIQFSLVPLGTSFDPKPYKEFLELAKSPDYTGPVTKEGEVEELLRIQSSGSNYKALVKLKFHITDDVSVPVSINSLGARRPLPTSVPLYAATNEVVSSKTIHLLADDDDEEGNPWEEPSKSAGASSSAQSTLEQSSFIHCENVGGRIIAFTPEEIEQINSLKAAELRLIGFKSMEDSLSYQLHLHACALIFPTEATAQGSIALFTALMKRCLAKKVVAFCTYYPRKTATVRYVILVPSLSPEGFIMIHLPFGSEIRDVELEPATCTQEQVEVMKKVVKKMRFAYKPENFPNPRIACHWASVEALALDLFEPEPVPDASLPNYEALSVRLGDLTDEVFKTIYGGEYQNISKTSSKSLTPTDVMDDIAAVETHFKHNTMKQLTVSQLKSYLKSVGLSAGLSTLKKADLMDAAAKHLQLQKR